MSLHLSKRVGALLAAGLLVAGCSSGSGTDGKDATVLGTLAGTVTGSTGAAIAGVLVTPSPAAVPAVTTDSRGKYSLSVPAGTYTLSFTGDNLEPATSASAVVTKATTTTVDQVMAASTLKVTVNLPAALLNGGPAGFNTTVSGITTVVTKDGSAVTPDSITWAIKDYYGVSSPPAAATPSPATGSTTSFDIADFESLRQGANSWLNTRYGLAATADPSDFQGYVQAPERDQLLSFGVQQVRAMSYKLIATVKMGSYTSTGSAVVAPLTISSGVNTLPLGMMVVANAPTTATYAWKLEFLPMSATSETYTDVTASLQGADTKNPYIVPTEAGVYRLTNGSDAPLYFRISTYHGAGTASTDKGSDGVACADCHNGSHSLDDKFTEWNASAHGNFNWEDPFATPASLFKLGVTGFEGTHYTENCISCHTVGYSKVPSAVNNGFDDVAKATGWTFPTTYDAAAWDTVTANPGILHRAGIQCESCHGPLEPTDHSQPLGIPSLFSKPVAPTASMSAGVCLVCHDALGNHDKGPLWATSPHANQELAMEESTVEGRGTGVNHCGRCHAGEGFVLYAAIQQTGATGAWDVMARPAGLTPAAATCTPRDGYKVSGQPYDPLCPCRPSGSATTCTGDPAWYSYFASAGLTNAGVHSQTCQTCHDPHSTELRVDGDTQEVAGRFRVQNAGAGALCMVCHNSRSAVTRQGAFALTDWSSPHAACQGDIFAGRNAFFVANLTNGQAAAELPNLTKHSFMADACADCHVKWVPSDIKAQFNPAGTNHTFRSSLQICAECHSADIGERVQEGITEKMGALKTKLSAVLGAKMLVAGFDAATRNDATTGASLPAPANPTVTPAQVRSIVVDSTGTRLFVALADGTAFRVNLANILVAGTASTTKTKLFTVSETNTQVAAKAFYNMLLINNDGAKGIHNPAFASMALENAAAALTGVTIP